jgi:Ca2+/Na+ antiporter
MLRARSGICWFFILCWIFVPGVALGADVFMTAIEVITSKENTVLKKVNGVVKEYHVRTWNETVANLTLMALGSSAPEILLSVIEIVGGNFYAGDLGPSTIVGSAAFNLMIITAVCIVSIPKGETRTIKQLGVFLTTSAYSIFAYIWLLIIVLVSSPNVITITEGLLTCIFLLLLILQAFFFDRNGDAIARVLKSAATSVSRRPKGAFGQTSEVAAGARVSVSGVAAVAKEKGFSKDATPEEIAAALKADVEKPKTRAHYKRQTMKRLGGAIIPSKSKSSGVTVVAGESVKVTHTRDASESAPPDSSPSLTQHQHVSIDLGVGQAFSAELGGETRLPGSSTKSKAPPAGILRWEKENAVVSESEGKITVVVERVGGHTGEVSVDYKTKDQDALAGKDYHPVSGTLTWPDGDCDPQEVEIGIIDDESYENDEHFTVVLSNPTGGAIFDHETDGGADETIMTVTIMDDSDRATAFKKAMFLLRVDMDSLDLASADWCKQLRSVFVFREDDDEELTVKDRITKSLAVPWKLMFALVPPPGLCGGWLCFLFSLVGIAIQVVLISDFASQMGCQMGLKDSVTAITFVALGTSLPDTFASVQAAVGDKHADNSIGNVTGSNSVNVFFGLGVPWLIAAIYWSNKGQTDEWRRRYGAIPGLIEEYPNGAFVVKGDGLGFSVVIFSVCAVLTIALILARRFVPAKPAELGGDRNAARASAAFLVCLWFFYIMMSSIKSYEVELGLGTFGF